MVRKPASETAAPPLIVLMHGYGSDEKDLFSLSTYLPGKFLIVSARAPYPLPGGGNQWFERSRQTKKYDAVKEQMENSRMLVLKFISEIHERYHTSSTEVYVMGFSQGAIMSYATGLTAPEKIKGIGVLSGILPSYIRPRISENHSINALRIFVAHGTQDPVLPYDDGKEAVTYLESKGLKPEMHSYPGMPHTISREVINDLNKWLLSNK